MVSPQHEQRLGVGYFQGQDENKDFDGKIPTIHIISEEDIFIFVRTATNAGLYKLKEIVELAMDVASDGHRILNLDQIGLRF